MNGSMVDTNAIIRFLKGDTHAKQLFETVGNISVPVTVMGELFYGAYKSKRVQDNLALFTSFLSRFPIVEIDDSIAMLYGEIKTQLLGKGVNIPENDIWIAATAKSKQCILITFDKHFAQVDGLMVKN